MEVTLINATCLECRGPLAELKENGGMDEFVCLVGHRYSPRVLLDAHSSTQERALWAAVLALEETEKIVQALAHLFPPDVGERLLAQAREKQRQAQQVRDILQNLEPFRLE